MTQAVEFTYLYNSFSVSIPESVLTRAVRIKTAVKDKIKRVFSNNEVNVNNVVVENPVKESLIDLSNENLLALNNALNVLENQQNVSTNANRAVLFTQPLAAKIFRVTGKWFDGMPRVEKQVDVPVSDMPSVDMINHLGGEVVPGNWNQVEEKEAEINPLPLEPTLEAVPNIEIDTPVEETSQSIEIPTSLGNTDVYRFNFDMENVLPTLEPVVPVETKEETPTMDFVPEPKQIEGMVQNEVSLPESQTESVPSVENNIDLNLPSFEPVINNEVEPQIDNSSVEEKVVDEREDKINDLLTKEFKENPANNFVPEFVDNRPAEVKIDALLGRKSVLETETTVEETVAPVQEETVVNSVPEVKEDRPEITQGQVLARLRRLNNAMAEKDATIKNLSSKNESLKEEVAVSKDKVAEYEIKVNDLSAKNSDLSSQNERLSAKLEEVETSSKSTISKLEAKVDELTQSKSEELESLRKQLEELKEKHSSEISSMREKHALELKAVNDSKEKQIQAIYATITDALGDTSMDADYSKGMAA